MEKKRGIVLFDEGKEGMEMLYIDDDGFLRMPKKQYEENLRLDGSTKKHVLGWIKDDNSEYK